MNEAQFQFLVEAGGDEAAALLTELLDLFQSDVEERLRKYEEGEALPNRHELLADAHSLTGGAANLGAHRLAELGVMLEQHAASISPEELRALCERIRDVYEETVAWMEARVVSMGNLRRLT